MVLIATETRIRVVRKELTPGTTVEAAGWDYRLYFDFILEDGQRIPSSMKRRSKKEIYAEFRKLPMEIHHLEAVFINGEYRCNDYIARSS